jgi:hypothetical protein
VFVALDLDVNSIFVMWNIAKLGFVVVGANFSVLKDSNTVSKGGKGGRKKALESVKFLEEFYNSVSVFMVFLQIHIMTLLDARSLARTAAVCTQWRAMALADWLWQPLCDEFWTKRAHIPLCLVLKSCKLSPYLAYAISVADSKQVLTPTNPHPLSCVG